MATLNITSYDQGDVIQIKATFAVNGVATDPTSVTITIKEPDGTLTSHTGTAGGLTNPTIGTWQWLETPDQPGLHNYSVQGTGTAAAYEEGRYYVRVKQVA
jgi:hypothetical protein